MARVILDPKLIAKLAGRLEKTEKYTRETVSKFAHKTGVASEVALIILAKRNGIGTALYQRSLDPTKQAQVREALPRTVVPSIMHTDKAESRRAEGNSRATTNKKNALKGAIEYLVRDTTLLARCRDLLLARSNFDRAINQATQILEDRIRTKAKPPKKLTGEGLVGFAFNEDITKSLLCVDSGDAEDQRGFTQILRGIVPAFRNKSHHHITDSLSREEAMRIVGFIDVLLRVVDRSINKQSQPQRSP
jgi:uncharacterized protein (TIGR02391 family)